MLFPTTALMTMLSMSFFSAWETASKPLPKRMRGWEEAWLGVVAEESSASALATLGTLWLSAWAAGLKRNGQTRGFRRCACCRVTLPQEFGLRQ